MSKTIKRIVAVLTMLGMAVGLVGVPQVSEAAFTGSYSATTLYIEITNKRGNEWSQPLSLEAKRVGYLEDFGGNHSSISAVPFPITKVGGTKNRYILDIPAFSATVPSNLRYYEDIADFKINIPVAPTVSHLGIPNGNFQLHEYSSANNSWMIHGNSLAGPNWSLFNPDRTVEFALGDNKVVGGYHVSRFARRLLTAGSAASFTYAYGMDGNTVQFRLEAPLIEEIFEDDSGVLITPPPGYTNNNCTDVLTNPMAYQMANDSSLPKTYIDSGFIYTYKGWYKGAGNKPTMSTVHPPTISFSAGTNDNLNQAHIVYDKKALRIVNEEYIDTSSGTIEPSWNNMGQQKADGDTFTQTPAATKTDTSGTIWEYQGWKLDTEPMSAMRPESTPVSVLINANTTIQYVYKKKQHSITEKWVDQSDGSTLIPMTGNPKTSPIDDNDNFSGTASATITDTHGAIWDFVGWENVTDNAGIVNPSASYAVNTIKAAKEIRYHYQARNTTATLDLNPTPQVTASGGSVSWSSRLTNTGTSTLNNLKLKATSNWASGLSEPTQVTVTPAGGAPQNFTVTPVDWVGGFNLTGINVPNGGPNNYADITFTDTATGAVNQVLPAEIEIDGNMANSLKAENFVRIDDPNEPNLEPTGNAGLINIPKFDFGQTEVKPFAQKKGLDAASYQGTYNPYIRFMDNESNFGWDLTVKLGQFTSGSKTLPTATAIHLNNGDLKEVQDYNKHNESLVNGTSVGNKIIPSDGTTVALTNGAVQGVYQLDYAFNDVELDLLAHTGVAGFSYKATMDWTLTTSI